MEAEFTRSFLKHEESVRYKGYRDAVGKWTTGVGHLIKGNEQGLITQTLTEDGVNHLLDADVALITPIISKYIKVPINLYKRTAIISFCFNEGNQAFIGSNLLKQINANASEEAIRHEFMKWDKADGSHNGKDDNGNGIIDEPGELQVLKGLENRRMDEANLFYKK